MKSYTDDSDLWPIFLIPLWTMLLLSFNFCGSLRSERSCVCVVTVLKWSSSVKQTALASLSFPQIGNHFWQTKYDYLIDVATEIFHKCYLCAFMHLLKT